MSTERIIVHSSIATDFKAILIETIKRTFGSDADTPVLITAAAARRNHALVADAVHKGAKPLSIFGEDNAENRDWLETKMRPVVLTNIDKSMDIYKHESFGPSVSLFTFETEANALDLANDTDYGLAASVFTDNFRDGFRFAESLQSGTVHINTMTVHDEFVLPHGGVKKSGFGRFNGYQGLEEFLYPKTVTWME